MKCQRETHVTSLDSLHTVYPALTHYVSPSQLVSEEWIIPRVKSRMISRTILHTISREPDTYRIWSWTVAGWTQLGISWTRWHSQWHFVSHPNTFHSDLDITGSCAELYIEPGETCIGDVDLMFSRKDQIVMCDGLAVDSIDVSETVDVYKIEASNCPNGYVHLRSVSELQFNWDTGRFEYRVSNTKEYLFISSSYDADMTHGPAIVEKGYLIYIDNSWFSVIYTSSRLAFSGTIMDITR